MPDFAHGTPSWVELITAEPEPAAAFYRGLFGWETAPPVPPGDGGEDRVFEQDGKAVAGLRPSPDPAHKVVWITYVSVESAATTARAVAEAGGTVVIEPTSVPGRGQMAFCLDPSGAGFAIWEAAGFAGADLVGVPNSLWWFEILTWDMEAALEFYPRVFGWSGVEPDFVSQARHGGIKLWKRADGRLIGGLTRMTEETFPADLPPHWSICFAVADRDATTARAERLGATLAIPPMEAPFGKFAGLVDPQGAAFEVIALND